MAWGIAELLDHLVDHALARWLAWVAAAAKTAAAGGESAGRTRATGAGF
jgi:hypothetical protein